MSVSAVRIPLLVTPRGRGVGDYYSDHCGGSWSWLNPFCYTYLNRDVSRVASGVIESGFPAPPPPVPIARTVLVPTGGVDVAGNPTYDVVPETPAENQAANVAQLNTFFANVADANAPGSSSPLLWAGLAAAAVGALWLLGGRRGR